MKTHLLGSACALALLFTAGAEAQLPAFHGNAQRTGYSPFAGPSPRAVLKWKLNLGAGGAIISSPVVAPDGTIFLGSVLRDVKYPEHFITAVNPDGTVKWRFKTGYRDTQTQSSPAVGPDGTVYVGAQDGAFYALHPDGTLAWKYQGSEPVQQHPVVARDGTVYVGIDGRLHAFSAAGALKWTVDLGYDLPGGPSLSPDETTVYAFTFSEAEPVTTLVALNTAGAVKWRYYVWDPYFPGLCPPTVLADGTVLITSAWITALDPVAGANRWYYTPSSSHVSSYSALAATPAGEIVFALDYNLGKLRADGTQVWLNDFVGGTYGSELESTFSSPLVDRLGNIYVGLGHGKRSARPWAKAVRCYTAAGALKWEFPLGEGTHASSPTLGPDGTLYIGCMDGSLYALKSGLEAVVRLTSLTLSPTGVIGSYPSTGTVTLDNPAPTGGAGVALVSGNTAAAQVPATVTVPAGSRTATFKVTTRVVTGPASAVISASYGGVTRTATLSVSPDTVAVTLAEYRRSRKQLTVRATGSSAAAVLRVYATATNAYIGTLANAGGGSYTGLFTLSTKPASITVRSSLGGTAVSAVTSK
jgi:hypothetical protein